MEFLRFGSSIPGKYWGCCAMCIIQDFNQDPDTKASIQLVSGDGDGPIMRGDEFLYAGPTYKDIFLNRLRIGTFDNRDMPNHGFLAILTQNQLNTNVGKKWLALLKEAGFEFIRTVDNSVYSGQNPDASYNCYPNYLFGLFRNIGKSAVPDPTAPPAEWLALPEQTKTQRQIWDEGKTVLLSESEVVAAGAPVTLAGLRSKYPPQTKSVREELMKKNATASGTATTSNPFGIEAELFDPDDVENDDYCDDADLYDSDDECIGDDCPVCNPE